MTSQSIIGPKIPIYKQSFVAKPSEMKWSKLWHESTSGKKQEKEIYSQSIALWFLTKNTKVNEYVD